MYSQYYNNNSSFNNNNLSQTPSPPLSTPTSPNNDFVTTTTTTTTIRRKSADFLKKFSSSSTSPNTCRQFDHNLRMNYCNSRLLPDEILMSEPIKPIKDFYCYHYDSDKNQKQQQQQQQQQNFVSFVERSSIHEKESTVTVPHNNMGNTSITTNYLHNLHAKISTCFNETTLTTMQTTAKLNTAEIEPNFDHKIHIVGRNHCSLVKYQKIAPNLKIDTNSSDDSSSLMKINYLLNSPINSPISSTSPMNNSQRFLSKVQKTIDKPFSERKRKSNSLARAMQDRGLLKSTLNITSTTFTETKSVLFPTQPTMEINELKQNIESLNIDTSLLDDININIKWKGQPLNITHLKNYHLLHQKEAHVTSILRLTPVQYLTSKYVLISSARRYIKKNLPFRKSDAQKLLRIDVNKASKLWEFFQQIRWI